MRPNLRAIAEVHKGEAISIKLRKLRNWPAFIYVHAKAVRVNMSI
jgi:hypothetical protein